MKISKKNSSSEAPSTSGFSAFMGKVKAKLKKLLIITASIVFLILAGAFTFAYFKLQKSEIKNFIIQKIQEKIPGSEVAINELEYTAFPDVNATINNIEIKSKDKKNIAKIDNVIIELPLWVMLFDRGTVNVKVMKLDLNYNELDQNYRGGGGGSELSSDGEEGARPSKQHVPTQVPAFIKKSTLNFELKNSSITYAKENGAEAKIKLENVDFKDAGFENDFTFSIKTALKIKLKDAELSPALSVEGKINLSSILEKGDFKNSSKFKLTKLEYNKEVFPTITGEIKFDHKSEEINAFNIKASFDQSNIVSEVIYNPISHKLIIKKLESKIQVSPFLKMFPTTFENYKLDDKTVIKLEGDGLYFEEKFEGNFITKIPDEFSLKLKSGSFLNLKPVEAKFNLKALASDNLKSEVNIGYSGSKISFTATKKDSETELQNFKASMQYDDVSTFLPVEYKKLQKSQPGSFEVVGNVKFHNEAKEYNLKINNKNLFEYNLPSGDAIEFKSLDLETTSEKEKQKLESVASFILKLKGQSELIGNSNIKGDLNLDQYMKDSSIIGALKVNATTQKKIAGKMIESSSLSLNSVIDHDKIEISDMKGNLSLKEITPFIPTSGMTNLKNIDPGNSVLKFAGAFNLNKDKIEKPTLDLNLSAPIKIDMKTGDLDIEKLKFNFTKMDQNFKIGYNGESQISFKPNNSKSVGIKTKYKGNLDLNELIKNKKLNTDCLISTNTNSSALELNLNVSKDEMSLDKIKGDISIAEIKTLAPASLTDLLKSVEPNKSKLSVTGNWKSTQSKLISSSLKMVTEDQVDIYLETKQVGHAKFEGEFNNNGYTLESNIKMLDGDVKVSAHGPKISNISNLFLNDIFPKSFKVSAQNLKLSNNFIKKLVYTKNETAKSKEKISSPTTTPVQAVKTTDTFKELPPFNIELEVKNLLFSGETINSTGSFTFKNEHLDSNNIVVKIGAGEALAELHAFLKEKQSEHQYGVKLNNVKLSSLNAILPPSLERVSGDFSGEFKAKFNLEKLLITNYDIDYNFTATNGEFKNFNLTNYIKESIEKIDVTKVFASELNVIVSDKFSKLELAGKANPKAIKVSKFDFKGFNNTSSISGSGDISQPGTKGISLVELKYLDNTGKLSGFLKTTTGNDAIALRLTGIELDLKPDTKSIMREMAATVIETQAQKALQKGAEKALEKTGPSFTEKIGSFFGNLFKKTESKE
jgi:hypothetical protein